MPRTEPDFQDRRLMRRFDMRLPAVVRFSEKSEDGKNHDRIPEGRVLEFETETQNVSARGVYFYFDRTVPAGSSCEIILTFPPHITLTDAVRVRFQGRVIRSESPLPSARVGTAVVIEDYEFLRANGSNDLLSALQKGLNHTN
jgi:hypothetical protein